MDAMHRRRALPPHQGPPGGTSTSGRHLAPIENFQHTSRDWVGEDELWRERHLPVSTAANGTNDDARLSLPRLEPATSSLADSSTLTFFSSTSLTDEPTHVMRSTGAFSGAAHHRRAHAPRPSDSGLSAQSSSEDETSPFAPTLGRQPKVASLDLPAGNTESAHQLRAQMISRRHVSLSTCSMAVSEAGTDSDDARFDDEELELDWDVWESAECEPHNRDLCWLPCEGSWSMEPEGCSGRHNEGLGGSAPQLGTSHSAADLHDPQTQAGSSDMEIKMVWPVCVPMSSDGNAVNARISAIVGDPSSSPQGQSDAPAEASSAQLWSGEGSSSSAVNSGREPPPPPGSVLVMAGSSMELLARAPIKHGIVHCAVPASRNYSLQGTAFLNQSQSQNQLTAAHAAAPIRVLTLFATNAGNSGPAVNLLCAAPHVAKELNGLFAHIAGNLLLLETDPCLPHVQLRDVHGYTILPGSGSCCAASTSGRDVAGHMSLTFGSSSVATAPQPKQGSIKQRLCCSHDAPGPCEFMSAQLTAQEQEMCMRTWTRHIQPLMREVAYLLMCVPGAFSKQQDGSQAWDSYIYCKTLAGMVAFLEHHRCWHTLAGLLQHASIIGVAFLYRGERVPYESLLAHLLEQLLKSSLHDDISVQYLQQAPECAYDWQPQVLDGQRFGGLRSSLDESPSCSFGAALHTSAASLRQCSDKDDAALESSLAGEFKDWEERWLVRDVTGNPIAPVLEEHDLLDHANSTSLTVPGCMQQKRADVLPWEVLALVVSCAVIAMHYLLCNVE